MMAPDTTIGTVNGGQTVRTFFSIIVSYIHVDNTDGFEIQI